MEMPDSAGNLYVDALDTVSEDGMLGMFKLFLRGVCPMGVLMISASMCRPSCLVECCFCLSASFSCSVLPELDWLSVMNDDVVINGMALCSTGVMEMLGRSFIRMFVALSNTLWCMLECAFEIMGS